LANGNGEDGMTTELRHQNETGTERNNRSRGMGGKKTPLRVKGKKGGAPKTLIKFSKQLEKKEISSGGGGGWTSRQPTEKRNSGKRAHRVCMHKLPHKGELEFHSQKEGEKKQMKPSQGNLQVRKENLSGS